jgi:hypothetical protein
MHYLFPWREVADDDAWFGGGGVSPHLFLWLPPWAMLEAPYSYHG